jgi:hypothetical protein
MTSNPASTMTRIVDETPTAGVADEFERFEDLTRQLLQTPKSSDKPQTPVGSSGRP